VVKRFAPGGKKKKEKKGEKIPRRGGKKKIPLEFGEKNGNSFSISPVKGGTKCQFKWPRKKGGEEGGTKKRRFKLPLKKNRLSLVEPLFQGGGKGGKNEKTKGVVELEKGD